MGNEALNKIKMDVLVINKDGKRDLFRCVPSSQLVKLQVAVSLGDGFILSDDDSLVTYAPGTVARVRLNESSETKEDK